LFGVIKVMRNELTMIMMIIVVFVVRISGCFNR